jgi:hypothetical protein
MQQLYLLERNNLFTFAIILSFSILVFFSPLSDVVIFPLFKHVCVIHRLY